MNQTEKYKLSQWVPEDRIQREDFNSDNAKIDTALTSLDTRLSGVDTRLSSVDTRLSGVDTTLSGIDTKLSSLDTTISNLNVKTTSITTLLDKTVTLSNAAAFISPVDWSVMVNYFGIFIEVSIPSRTCLSLYGSLYSPNLTAGCHAIMCFPMRNPLLPPVFLPVSNMSELTNQMNTTYGSLTTPKLVPTTTGTYLTGTYTMRIYAID